MHIDQETVDDPVLGDSSNNYSEPRAEMLKEVYERAKRIIWLNPENRKSGTTSDAEICRYSACCHQVVECISLMRLERVVGNLLKTVTQSGRFPLAQSVALKRNRSTSEYSHSRTGCGSSSGMTGISPSGW